MIVENPYELQMEKKIFRYHKPFHMISKKEMVDYLALGLIQALTSFYFVHKNADGEIHREELSCIMVGEEPNEFIKKKIDYDGFEIQDFKMGLEHPFSCTVRYGVSVGTIGALWRSNAEAIGIRQPNINIVDYQFCRYFDAAELNDAHDTFIEYLNLVPHQDGMYRAIEDRLSRCYIFWRDVIDDCLMRQKRSAIVENEKFQIVASKRGYQIPVYPESNDVPNLYDIQRTFPDALAYGCRLKVDTDEKTRYMYHLSLVMDRDKSTGELIPRIQLPTKYIFTKGQMGIDFLEYDICGITGECCNVIFTTLEGLIGFIENEL